MTPFARGEGGGGIRPWRLGARPRKIFLVAHIASAGAWIGSDVVMGVLVFTALFGDEETRALCYRALELFAVWPLIAPRPGCLAGGGGEETRALCYRALELFAVWPLIATGLVCLARSVVLGLGTKWGLIRYWWVAAKLVLNVVLVALVAVALRPAALGTGGPGGGAGAG